MKGAIRINKTVLLGMAMTGVGIAMFIEGRKIQKETEETQQLLKAINVNLRREDDDIRRTMEIYSQGNAMLQSIILKELQR